MKLWTPKKSTVEVWKTVTIAVLVTGIVAFIGGAKYEATVHAQTKAVVSDTTIKK